MMENVNNEDQIAKNMEPVQDNTPLDDDFYYENDDFDLDNIKEIEPIEIPNMNTNNETTISNVQENIATSPAENNTDTVSTQSQVEVPDVFASTPEPVVENSIPNFAADETEMNKIIEEVDKSENKATNDREYDGASFDDMFDSLYSDVEGANNFISTLIDQKKNVNENETELAEMREKLDKEKADFAKYVETQNENIRMEKVKCDEYIKTQKMRLQNEESQFNADVEATRTELNLGEQTLKIANEKLDTEKSQFEKYKELEEEKIRNDRNKLQAEIEQFEKYKELEEEKIKEANSKLDTEKDQFDKEKQNALEKIETGKKELEVEKDQFERYKELEEKKLEHESKNLSQSCARFKELVAQFNSGFQKLPEGNK